MDALIASAGPMKAGPSRPRPRKVAPHKTVDRGPDKEAIDPSTFSILNNTRVPSSFHQSSLPTGVAQEPLRPDASISKIKDKKLRAKVARNDVTSKRAKQDREDVNEWLNHASAGVGEIEVDEEAGEKTWKVGQDEIKREVGVASGKKKFDLRLEDMGDYLVDYTRNGR
jgi:U3 small nucleolar RNA-associated protein 7